MKLFLVFDSRIGGWSLEARNLVFRHWCSAIQELGIYAQHRGLGVCIICVGPNDYRTFLQIQQKCSPAIIHQAICQMASYIQLQEHNATSPTDTTLLLLKDLAGTFQRKKSEALCHTKLIFVSGNLHEWDGNRGLLEDSMQDFTRLQADLQCIHVFDQSNPLFTDHIAAVQKLSLHLKEIDNFCLTVQPVEDALICKHTRPLLAIKFIANLDSTVCEQRLLRCQATPLTLRLSEEAARQLEGQNVCFDIRARAKPSAVSQHVICGLPVALFDVEYLKYEGALTNLKAVCEELLTMGDVLILRSNLDPVSLLISPTEVRHLWVGMPATNFGHGVICVQGLISQESFVGVNLGISNEDAMNKENAKSFLEDLVELPLYNPLMYKSGLYDQTYGDLSAQPKVDSAATNVLSPLLASKRVLTCNPTPARRGARQKNRTGRGRAALCFVPDHLDQTEGRQVSYKTNSLYQSVAETNKIPLNASRKNEQPNSVMNPSKSRTTLCDTMMTAFGSTNK